MPHDLNDALAVVPGPGAAAARTHGTDRERESLRSAGNVHRAVHRRREVGEELPGGHADGRARGRPGREPHEPSPAAVQGALLRSLVIRSRLICGTSYSYTHLTLPTI